MTLRLALAVLLCLGCETEEPTPPTPPPSPTEIEEQTHAEQGGLTLSVREVHEDGWSGRLVVVGLAPGEGRRVRVLPSPRPQPLGEIVAGESPPQPFAAICGGFYDPSGRPMGLVRSDGRDVHPLGARGGSGVLVVRGPTPEVLRAEGFAPTDEVTDALQSIDRLVSRGESVVGPNASDRRAARSAIAVIAGGEIRLAVAFADEAVIAEDEATITLGPRTAQTGPTLAQWAALLRRPADEGGIGALDALGLDGGHSTSLVVKSDARALRVDAANATINAVLVTYGASGQSD